MKKWKNNLDEMQEEKLLKIEHNACWLAFWGLFAAIYIQIAIGNGGLERLGGEIIVMLLLSIYLIVDCIRNGIWDRKLKPNLKTNLGSSLIAGGVFGAFWFIVSYRNYHKLAGSFATFLIMFIIVSGLTFVLLGLVTTLYRRQQKKIDALDDQEEYGLKVAESMDTEFEFLVEKESMWAEMLMEVLKNNHIPYTALPIHGSGVTMRTGMQERLKIYVPRKDKVRAEAFVQDLFSEINE